MSNLIVFWSLVTAWLAPHHGWILIYIHIPLSGLIDGPIHCIICCMILDSDHFISQSIHFIDVGTLTLTINISFNICFFILLMAWVSFMTTSTLIGSSFIASSNLCQLYLIIWSNSELFSCVLSYWPNLSDLSWHVISNVWFPYASIQAKLPYMSRSYSNIQFFHFHYLLAHLSWSRFHLEVLYLSEPIG